MLSPQPTFDGKLIAKSAAWLISLLVLAGFSQVFGQTPVNYAIQIHPLFAGNGGCSGLFCHDDISDAGNMRLNVAEDSTYKEVALEISPKYGTTRVNRSNAAGSLLLLLPSGQTPPGQSAHSAGTRPDWAVGQSAYNITLQWIQEGAFRFLAPTPAVATVISSNRIDLAWNDKSNGEARFRIERKTGTGAFVFLANAAANAQSFSDLNASPNTSYTYNVRAENAAGNFLSAFATSTAVTTPPLANPVPTLSNIAPVSGVLGQTLDVIFTGMNFINGVTTVNAGAGITVNPPINITSPTSLTANLTIASTTTTGPRNVFVSNGPPGGGNSTTRIFTVNNPAPALTNLAPPNGNRLQTLDVVFTGMSFIDGVTKVNVDPDFTLNRTTFNSATSLTANLTIKTTATTGAHNLSVSNDPPGGGSSGNLTFTVNNPAPTLTSLTPAAATLGQTLDVVFTGANFIDGVSSVSIGAGITVNNPVIVNNANTLTANLTILASAASGNRNFSVINSGPGGGASNNVNFTIAPNRAPTVISAIPAQTLIAGGSAFTQNLTQVFSDPDGDVLTFTTSANPAGIVTASISGSTLSVAGSAVGSTTVTITASDGKGGATPTNFAVTVNAPTRAMRVTDVTALRGSNVSIPIILLSEGDENALGFSLRFDPASLSNPQSILGKDATGAQFNVNALQQSQGRYGLVLALPTGQRFSAGAREIAVVTFAVNPNASAATTIIEFGDQPVGREIVNANAGTLASAYTAGVVTLQTTSVGAKTPGVPITLRLEQNYPNPISVRSSSGNPGTMIKFSLPRAGHVTLKVYSLLGKEIAALVDRELAPGNYEARWEAPGLESGVYFYRLQSGVEVMTRKLVLMR